MSANYDFPESQGPEPGSSAPDLAGAAPDRARVLIVDDHAPSRDICAGYLDLFDHASHGVGGAAEAVAALRRERFDLVVLNVHMDETPALDTLRAIRALPSPASAAPIIGLTAIGREHEAQRWLAAGLVGVLPKPLTAARLFAALNATTPPTDPTRSWAPA